MSFSWDDIRKNLYGILKASGRGLVEMTMYDESGNETLEPLDANRYYVTFKSKDADLESFTILVAIRDEGQKSHVDIKTPGFRNNSDFEMILELIRHIRSAIGLKEGIKINWRDFDKTIDPREEAVNNIKESKDVGKIFGTTKSSFQKIGEAKLIIRHSSTVNEEKHGARTRHIRALFVENSAGERFSFPHLHMTGARAFTRHISNGGSTHDQIANKIYSLSEDYIKLRRSLKEVKLLEDTFDWTIKLRESMNNINKRLKRMHGPKGYANATQELLDESIVIDETAIQTLHDKLAEMCGCSMEDPLHADLSTAAKYITTTKSQDISPFTFAWNRKPNLESIAETGSTSQSRLYSQIMELADACSDTRSSEKLKEIAENISAGCEPFDDEMELVKEAFTSGLQYNPAISMIPEEVELDEFFDGYTPEAIFSENIITEVDNQYPDTEEGAIAALGNLSTHSMKGAKARPDPYIKGVWLVSHRNGKSIVYLKGYDDQSQVMNDFEDISHRNPGPLDELSSTTTTDHVETDNSLLNESSNFGNSLDIIRLSKLAGI